MATVSSVPVFPNPIPGVVVGLLSLLLAGPACTPTFDVTGESAVVFVESVSAELTTRRTPDGQILVEGSLSGRTGWFIFDTGAGGNVIDQRVADELDLTVTGFQKVEGAATIDRSPIFLASSFQIGPMVAQGVRFIGVDLTFASQAWEIEILGILGSPLLERATVEAQFNPPRAALFDPAQYRLRETSWLPARLDNGQLLVFALFNGHEGIFRLDTGATWNGIIHTPSVERFALLEDQETESARTAGVGGEATFEIGRLESLEVWGERHEDLRFSFSTSTDGAFATDDVTGNLGAGLLGSRTLILDYSRGRYAIAP